MFVALKRRHGVVFAGCYSLSAGFTRMTLSAIRRSEGSWRELLQHTAAREWPSRGMRPLCFMMCVHRLCVDMVTFVFHKGPVPSWWTGAQYGRHGTGRSGNSGMDLQPISSSCICSHMLPYV